MWSLALAALALSASEPPSRAFTVLGPDASTRTLPSRGSTIATDVSRPVADITTLPDGRIVVLTETGELDSIDGRGRIARVPEQVPGGESDDRTVDAAADGTLLVVSDRRLWRVGPGGTTTPLTAP